MSATTQEARAGADSPPAARQEHPRLRRDLEFTHRQAGDAQEMIVCDPLTGRFFRAGELEARLFALLDGETPVDVIAERMTSAFPRLPGRDVPVFIAQLDRLGFLEGSATVGLRARKPLSERLLYSQIRLANPDRLFTRLAPHVGWLYRPSGWVVVGVLFLLAAAVASASREEILTHLSGAARTPGFWLRMWIELTVIGTIHEFGHGLTCKHFGGRSTGIGVLWMYGMVCFYCDVSGAWMLPRKSQRLWVGFAGLYYQFIAGAAALLLWRVLAPGTIVSELMLVMAASCGLLSLINLNPFLKLDGYYLLSDWLEIPNLRQRAFGALGQRLTRFWSGGGRSTAPTASPREQRICLAYGVLSAVFLAWFLALFFKGIGGYLTGRFAGAGAVFLFVLVGMMFGSPVAQIGVACVRWLWRWKEIPMIGRHRLILAGGGLLVMLLVLAIAPGELRLTNPCRLEAVERGTVRAGTQGRLAELRVHEGKRVQRGDVIGYLATFEREQRLVERRAQFQAILAESEALAKQLPAVKAAVLPMAVFAGNREGPASGVPPPEVVPMRMTEAERRAEAARADLQAAHARLAEAQTAVRAQSRVATRLHVDADRAARGSAPPTLAAARELWQQRVAERDLARRDLQRLQRLLKKGYVSPQQVDTARGRSEVATRLAGEALQGLKAVGKNLRDSADDAAAELARRRAVLATARAAVASAEATEAAAREAARCELLTRRTHLDVKRHEAQQMAAQIAILSDELQRSALIAPCDGVITTARVEERVGALFGEGATVLEVEDPRTLFTRIFVNERDLGEVRAGQPVALRVAAFPGRLYQGRVSEIAPRLVRAGTPAFPTNIVEVRLQIENATGELRPGMTGWAKIHCGGRPLGGILLRRVSRYLRTEVWSWF
jgi:multidrug resistance efflux pump